MGDLFCTWNSAGERCYVAVPEAPFSVEVMLSGGWQAAWDLPDVRTCLPRFNFKLIVLPWSGQMDHGWYKKRKSGENVRESEQSLERSSEDSSHSVRQTRLRNTSGGGLRSVFRRLAHGKYGTGLSRRRNWIHQSMKQWCMNLGALNPLRRLSAPVEFLCDTLETWSIRWSWKGFGENRRFSDCSFDWGVALVTQYDVTVLCTTNPPGMWKGNVRGSITKVEECFGCLCCRRATEPSVRPTATRLLVDNLHATSSRGRRGIDEVGSRRELSANGRATKE